MEPDVLLGDGVGDGVDRAAHDLLVDRADAADTQGVDLVSLPGWSTKPCSRSLIVTAR